MGKRARRHGVRPAPAGCQRSKALLAASLRASAEKTSRKTTGRFAPGPAGKSAVTGYGYVEAGSAVAGEICSVSAFKEKPDLATAQRYLQAGNYLWNAGIFVWNVHTIMTAISKYKPQIANDMDRIRQTGDVATIFPQCEKISIDFAVMEPAAAEGRVYTHPADFGWSDLGNWASLHDKLSKDSNGNGSVGNVRMYECHDCVVHAEDCNKVVLQGLDGYIVSEKNGRILVCRRSEEQRIKEFSQAD